MILDDIVAHKRKELAESKNTVPLEVLQKAMAYTPSHTSFINAIRERDFSLIAEIKKASPSAGVIVDDFDPLAIAKTYQSAGATALSILTERKYFQGDLDTLRYVKQQVPLPVLRKDFIFDAYQIFESKIYGADALLLIVSILQKPLLQNLLGLTSMLEMTALVEVHTEKEMELVLGTDAELIGINNRDLKTLKVDLGTTERLISKFPEVRSRVIVAESGIQTSADVARLKNSGVKAILVGESILRSANIPEKIRDLLGETL